MNLSYLGGMILENILFQMNANYCEPMKSLSYYQGTYYLAFGLWPILHMRSFEKVTGHKKDDWLVKTVGLLLGVTGGVLIYNARNRLDSKSITTIAIGQAIVLGGVSFYYARAGRISKIYFLDALLEGALILSWLIGFWRQTENEIRISPTLSQYHDTGLRA